MPVIGFESSGSSEGAVDIPASLAVLLDNEAQAVLYANSTIYGLAASVWTRDLDRAQRLQRSLSAGLVWINCWMERDLRVPFGGVKQSGLGREGGLDAMRFFTEPKAISIVHSLETS